MNTLCNVGIEEYRVKVSVRNNLLLKAIESTGVKSVAEFCRVNDLSLTRLNGLICMRIKPINIHGEFCRTARDVMEVLGACPTDLWTKEQLNMRLEKNSTELYMDTQTLQAMMSGQAMLPPVDTPEELAIKGELSTAVATVLASLTNKEQQILGMRIKLDMTMEKIAEILNISKERVRQIEAKALRKLRHKYRAEFLRPFVE